jgi:hypothetical protein
MSKMNDQESHYVAELARLSVSSVSITMRIVEVQLAMMLRDIGIKGDSQTPFGKFKLNNDGSLTLESPNTQLQKMLNHKQIVDRVMRESSI